METRGWWRWSGSKANMQNKEDTRGIFWLVTNCDLYWQSLWKKSVEKQILAVFVEPVVGPQKFISPILLNLWFQLYQTKQNCGETTTYNLSQKQTPLNLVITWVKRSWREWERKKKKATNKGNDRGWRLDLIFSFFFFTNNKRIFLR
jgi:hypothetical protein